MRTIFLTLALVVGALPVCAQQVDTAPLEAWLKRHADMDSMRATFVQERSLPSLKEPVSTPGTLLIDRPGKLRWELGDPVKTVAVSNGENMILADIEEQTARRMDRDSNRAKRYTLLADETLKGDLAGFREAFEIVEATTTRGIYQLTTRPAQRAMREQVPWVFFDIDPSSNELRALEVQLEDETRIRTVFSDTTFGAEIDPARFEFDLDGFDVR